MLLMMFLGLRKLGNICCGHKMFLNKIRNIFCVSDTKFVSATNVARGQTGKHLCRQQCVRNNVSSFASILKVRRMWSFHVVVLQRTAKKCTKIYNARAQPFFSSLNLLFGDVFVGNALVVCNLKARGRVYRVLKVCYLH